jgi:aminodeoxyfutalosine deaminase
VHQEKYMKTSSSIQQYLHAAPKAELHVHLEGSIQPATLLTLARRNGVELPVQTIEEMQQWFNYRDFDHFIDIYLAITRCLRTVEDYELIAYEFGANMARQNIRYAEVTFSPSTHRFVLNIPHDIYFTGLTRGRERARAEFGVEIRWVFDIVRNVEDEARNRSCADYTTAVAIESMTDGVVALGLGGAEVGYPPERFKHWFDQARAAGLHSAPHAGETVGPASVWGAIRALGAERLGHGVRSIEDPELIKYIVEQRIPLEVCPTSNIRLGVYPSIEQHPLPALYAAGVPVTVNSDDPPLFNTTLTHEVELLDSAFHFDLDTINELLLNGVRYSFLPAEQKQAMEATFRAEMARLS